MWVRPLAECDAACGGKASGLARLLAAGLRVPDGFVVEAEAFRSLAALAPTPLDGIGHAIAEAAAHIEQVALPAELVAEIEARARALGELLAVRSSATIEDSDAGTGAGIFSSRTAVPAAAVWPAIRAVWASALTPLAASYARRREAAIAIGVIVQRFVPGERIVVYTRPPGEPTVDAVLIQRAGRIHRLSRADPRLVVILAAEHAIAASSGADLELVLPEGDGLGDGHLPGDDDEIDPDEVEDVGIEDVDFERAWIVQARPIVHPVAHVRVPPPPGVIAMLEDGRCWTWDVAHNPDPLSPAQAGLVERIERAGFAPWSLRVCAGYLYSTPRARPVVAAAQSREELERRAAEIEARLARTLERAGSLVDAIAGYLAFYEIWATELVPLIAASRGAKPALAGDRPSAVEATLFAAARGELDEAAVLERLGVLSPAWDVAVPTFAERPGLIRDAIARARGQLRMKMTPELRRAIELLQLSRDELAVVVAGGAAPDHSLALAAADLAERDDVWFARAQWMVRRAIASHAAAVDIATDDAYWLPLDELSSLQPDPRAGAARRASGARAATARAAKWQMPITVGCPPVEPGETLHGVGTGARVTGRVVRFGSLASAIVVGTGDVVVTRAITPALAVIVIGCAAIVSETGGLLDHGAALARELGIPCVVGCRDAWSLLSDGMLVTVDGNAGAVTR